MREKRGNNNMFTIDKMNKTSNTKRRFSFIINFAKKDEFKKIMIYNLILFAMSCITLLTIFLMDYSVLTDLNITVINFLVGFIRVFSMIGILLAAIFPAIIIWIYRKAKQNQTEAFQKALNSANTYFKVVVILIVIFMLLYGIFAFISLFNSFLVTVISAIIFYAVIYITYKVYALAVDFMYALQLSVTSNNQKLPNVKDLLYYYNIYSIIVIVGVILSVIVFLVTLLTANHAGISMLTEMVSTITAFVTVAAVLFTKKVMKLYFRQSNKFEQQLELEQKEQQVID